MPSPRSILALGVLTALACVGTAAAQLSVVTVAPTARIVDAPIDSAIVVDFDRAIDPTSVVANRSFWAYGRWSGPATGIFSFANGDQRVILTPTRPFSAGEMVTVVLSHDLEAMDGTFLRAAGFSWQFWTRAGRAGMDLVEIDRMTTRTTPGASSRAYGGFAADLDHDGHLDITIVNEDTDDLRVFLNRADGSGLFDSFLTPTATTGNVPSPSEPADFDADGVTDVAVANTLGGSFSVLLGNGDGTFGAQQLVGLPGHPRGIAVLDVDGDGDLDVAATGRNSHTVSISLNDGAGSFGVPTSFGSGNGGEWAMVAGDLDEDGVLDLVVGAQDNQTVYVYGGDGDGTFSLLETQNVGGAVWMLGIGDVDGDRHEDIVAVNSSSNNAALLLGDGTGQLSTPQTRATDSFPLATDLGDLDGDGDLDWITSSFGGDWQLWRGDGAGGFVFDRSFDAPQAASCALMMDIDTDGDLDLALIDELEDEVILIQNRAIFADGFASGDTGAWSVAVP